MSSMRRAGSPPGTESECSQYSGSRNRLALSLESARTSPGASSVLSAGSTTSVMREPATSSQLKKPIVRLVFDADGCLYNETYRKALRKFVYDIHEELFKFYHAESKTEADQKKLISFLESKVVNDEYSRVTDDLFRQAGEALCQKYPGYSINQIMFGFIDMLLALEPKVLFHLLVMSNTSLLQKMMLEREIFSGVVMMLGSHRQSNQDNINNRFNGMTGCYFRDMHLLVAVFKRIHGSSAALDNVTMTDFQNRLFPGETYQRAFHQDDHHCEYDWDEKKGSMIYAYAHRSLIEHSGQPVTLQVYDNKQDIIDGLYELYNKHSYLLPKGLTLELIQYDGLVRSSRKIVGTGELDRDYVNSVNIMRDISFSHYDGERPIFDTVKSFSNADRVSEFIRLREEAKRKFSFPEGRNMRFFSNFIKNKQAVNVEHISETCSVRQSV